MSNRPAPLSEDEQADLGRIVLAMRADGICWKAVSRELGLGRVQLWRCARLARMKHLSGGMKHHEDCEAA